MECMKTYKVASPSVDVIVNPVKAFEDIVVSAGLSLIELHK